MSDRGTPEKSSPTARGSPQAGGNSRGAGIPAHDEAEHPSGRTPRASLQAPNSRFVRPAAERPGYLSATSSKSNEFFDSAQFPKIRFVSDSFPLVRMNHGGDLDGMLTLRGIEHPVHMTIDASDCDDPLRGDCAVEAWGSINRSQFGMHSRHGALSDKVQLRFSAFVEKHDPDRGS